MEPSGWQYPKQHVKENLKEKEQSYKAKITDVYRTIQVGDAVMPYHASLPCVLPMSAKSEIRCNIVSSQYQQQLINQYSVVYLDRGFSHGVQRGNLFDIVKTHVVPDPVNKNLLVIKETILPEIPIGMLLILESGQDTSTGIVLSAKENIPIGAFVKALSWEDKPEIFLELPSCPME